jgi:serine protease Do
MGVNIQDVTPRLAKEFNLKDNTGALVADVTPGSPADKAGIKAGDIVVEFNNKPVRDSRQLKLQVGQTAPNAKVPVKLMRDGSTKVVDVKLKELDGKEVASRSGKDSNAKAEETLKGVTVGDINARSREQLRLPDELKGAVVTSIDESSAAYDAGLREGDVILEINRKPVKNAEEAVESSAKVNDDRSLLLRVWSRGGTRYLVVNEEKES